MDIGLGNNVLEKWTGKVRKKKAELQKNTLEQREIEINGEGGSKRKEAKKSKREREK